MINCLFCINCSDELKDKVINSVHGVNIDFKFKNDISDLNGYEVVVGNGYSLKVLVVISIYLYWIRWLLLILQGLMVKLLVNIC